MTVAWSMQFQQLPYFVAVAETRHFTRAAERVHVAQPSLSQQIRALERELGAELFSRARGNIALTDAGEALLPLARRILADADTARHEVQELAQLRRGRVRLGATPSLCTGLLPDVLRAFHDRLSRASSCSSRRAARTTSYGSWRAARSTWPWSSLPLPAAVPRADHGGAAAGGPGGGVVAGAPAPGRGGAPVRIADLRGRAAGDVPARLRPAGADAWPPAARRASSRTFTVEGGEMDAVLGFVRAGLGIAVVPEHGRAAGRAGTCG